MSDLLLAVNAPEVQGDTFAQLRERFRACWVRGSAWRLEVGELLYKIKEKAEYGEWGAFLDEFGLARSTADGSRSPWVVRGLRGDPALYGHFHDRTFHGGKPIVFGSAKLSPVE